MLLFALLDYRLKTSTINRLEIKVKNVSFVPELMGLPIA